MFQEQPIGLQVIQHKMTEGIEAINEVKEFIEKSKPALIVNRVPKKTLDFFYLLAKEECCDDYGMTIKHLVDFYKGAVGFGFERAESMAMEALEKVEELSSRQEEKPKVFKTLDGKEHEVK